MKQERGITLIALIITIIILLILAGVTLGTLSANGIFDKSRNARDQYTTAQNQENTLLNDAESFLYNETTANN